ncbi:MULTISPECIES: hypothetical protein [unclassified Caballeronia]|uniref:hypothetical protein n=1 Tax=unclassified Caballeronia TaxID=2646786 RepID=UPI002865C4E2|nr:MULTISPECIES: hypothetical protein [unclassified Caballeronia]MDR5815451.1 hypothetical protein [Caballeronia sp. LZ033]MDR5880179.1 hypothetical protein [Caballeronia sp. LZ032]
MPGELTSFFWSGDTLRSRSVSRIVLSDTLDVPAPSARVLADWQREITSQLDLEAGDVEPMSLARTQARWPDYRHCVQAMVAWTDALGLPGALASSDVALMACRGARYHHDGAQYGGAAFCNLFLSEDKGLDVHFPLTGQRIPLVRGTAMIFDTGQPHAVIPRGSSGFCEADFAPDQDLTQVFLTWELPVEDARIAQALNVAFDTAPATALQLDDEQVWVDGAPASLCPETGSWKPVGQPG